jgi:hypothetical protein
MEGTRPTAQARQSGWGIRGFVDMARKMDWQVRLGEREWARYTYARAETDSLKLLGSVQRGPRVGALGLTPDGRYVQVNGDHISELGTSQLRSAVARAQAQSTQFASRRPPQAPAPTPTVIVKRRRTLPGR